MLIWLNGAFGSGKTTLSEELRALIPGCVVYDPEHIGFAVRRFVPPAPSGDFQDLPVWRDLVVATVGSLRRHYDAPFVVPMTLVVPAYRTEIFDGLAALGEDVHEFWLEVPPRVLEQRISAQTQHPDPEKDRNIARWRAAQIERCVDARSCLPPTTHILSNHGTTPRDLADEVLATVTATGSERSSAG